MMEIGIGPPIVGDLPITGSPVAYSESDEIKLMESHPK
jgi:hypothetical protein